MYKNNNKNYEKFVGRVFCSDVMCVYVYACDYFCVHDKHLGFSKVFNFCATEEESPGPSSGDSITPEYVAPLVRTKKPRSILANVKNTLIFHQKILLCCPKKRFLLT